MRTRNHWGWGYADEVQPHEELRAAAAGFVEHLGFGDPEPERPVALADVTLAAPRLTPPPSLAAICAQDDHARAAHARGKSYRDVVRGFRGDYGLVPDVVARPRDEDDVRALLEWCGEAQATAIPYGGGTSVVGGVEVPADGRPAVTIDLGAMDRVLEVDPVSRAARIQAGANGPTLEAQLKERGLTMRFYPQSFELSTLGGWIATRAGGHYATLLTHVDDVVESVRAVTPAAGIWESRRLPGSGAGPSPDRMLLGSEGTLGVITEAWVRVQEPPVHRASVGVRFAEFVQGAAALRALSQSGLYPSNCRLIDADEAKLTFAGDGSAALLVLGFESADHPVGPWMDRALELCADHGGTWEQSSGGREGAVGAWREAFLRAPYLRDVFVAIGVISETFETAITWDRFEAYHASIMRDVRAALARVCGGGQVSCRITHAYPDGPAPYFTIVAPARRGSELAQWDEIKAAAGEAIVAGGGTITHHHAVGRDHRPWYDRQRPDPFAAAFLAAKRELDPQGLLNPGVLFA